MLGWFWLGVHAAADLLELAGVQFNIVVVIVCGCHDASVEKTSWHGLLLVSASPWSVEGGTAGFASPNSLY